MLQPREADVVALFLVLVVLPLVTYILLGVWNEAARKKARISTLVQLAAEETFSNQGRPSNVVPTVTSLKTSSYVCARCFAPATTRCARCKSVRYCSGKCQISHWRLGHKEECQRWQNNFNLSAFSTPATESFQPNVTMDENSISQVLGDNMSELWHSDASSDSLGDPNAPLCTAVTDSTVTSGVSALHGKLSDKHALTVLERETHCNDSTASSDGRTICSGATDPTPHPHSLYTHMSAKNIPLKHKPGKENFTSDKTSRCQETSHIFAKAPAVLKNIMHQSHKSTSKIRKLSKERVSPDRSSSMPTDGIVVNYSDNVRVFASEKDQEAKFPSTDEMLESSIQAERSAGSRSVNYKKPPYTSGSKSSDKILGEHSSLKINRAAQNENGSSLPHRIVSTNTPLQSCNGCTDIGEMKMEVPRKSPKVPRRNIMGFMNYCKKNKVLFPYEELVKIFQCEIWDISPRGLLNCGNSCYANAVLQCLTCTKPLMIYLLQRLHSKTCCVRDWCLMCELEHHVAMLREGGGPFSPYRILSNMRNIGWRMGDGTQEDAHEFLRLLVMSMQSICLEGLGGEKKIDPVLQETTLIQQIFGGRLRSKVKCMRCHLESERYENIMDLTLEIHGWVESLEDALTQFTAPEDLDGENMYRCGRCSAYVKARKQLNVHEVPNILTVVLKRFQTGQYGKINKCVSFPDMLDMMPFMTGTADNPPLYMLYAVVVHLDTLNASFSGHYVSYVKDLQGTWFRIDDSEVQAVPLSRVMSEGAYMLFYSRSFPRPARAYFEKLPLQVPSPSDYGTSNILKSSRHEGDEQNGAFYASEKPFEVGNDFRPDYREAIEEFNQRYNYEDINSSREGHGNSFNLEFSDATSSDWSLFTSSDESSFTTESTRDSFSTPDYRDGAGLDSLSSIFGPFYGPEYSHSNAISCKKFSPCKSETRFFSESMGFVLDSSLPTKRPGDVHKRRNP